MRSTDMKAMAEEIADGYEEAKDEAFHEQFTDFISNIIAECESVTYEDIQGFLDNFDFPDEDTWSWNEVESKLDDIADQKYEEYKDKEMGL